MGQDKARLRIGAVVTSSGSELEAKFEADEKLTYT
jgi:hypothetical protein